MSVNVVAVCCTFIQRKPGEMVGPLDGLKVVDFSQVVSGPFAAMLLSDQGADVIKVEPLTGPGDMTRMNAGLTPFFINNNRGKRCLSVDLTSDGGRQISLDLCAQADIILENFRPGAMARLGLDYESVKALNSRVIYCSISGFGPTGPYSKRPVLDPMIQGLTGMVSRQLNPEIPFCDLVRNLISDKSTSLTAAQAISTALYVRERTGQGQSIEVPMLDATMYFFWPDGMVDKTLLDTPGGMRVAELYRLTECSDGKIVYFAGNDPMVTALCAALGHPEWRDDPRFATMAALASSLAHVEALGALIADSFLTMTMDEALSRLIEHDVPCGPILDADQAIADVQLVHNETLEIWDHPEAGKIQQPRPAARFSETPAVFKKSAGLVGQHNDEILTELGHTSDQIEALRAANVIG